MKTSTIFIILIIGFLFLIILSTCSSCTDYMPYSPYLGINSTLVAYPYNEGFSEYTTYPENMPIDSYNSKLITPLNMPPDAVKVKGVNGLAVAATAESNSIDIFSAAAGNPTAKSYGLTNSQGFLQLTPQQVQLLTHRGGNMSGSDSTIGY